MLKSSASANAVARRKVSSASPEVPHRRRRELRKSMELIVTNHFVGGGARRARMTFAAAAGGAALLFAPPSVETHAETAAAKAAPATPVSVAVVESRNTAIWDEFSGRLEAIDRVEIRSRVAGAVQAVHFREGTLVKQGDRLITIDPAPYAAEVDRARAQVVAAEARVSLARKEQERAQQLRSTNASAISESIVDQRVGTYLEAEANLRAAQAALQSAQLSLDYTDIRAPVAGRVGKLEITVGNLIAAGPSGPLLTTLVSVHPIYASFNADEQVVLSALRSVGNNASDNLQIERIPVEMVTATHDSEAIRGHLQLVDNQVDARSGTVRVRAMFDNVDGRLMPGQFARVRMGQAIAEPLLAINERAVGTDQNKKFVFVVGDDNKAAYREVMLGATTDGLRVVTSGLAPGERIIVNGLQRIRPGVHVVPHQVPMNAKPEMQAQSSSGASEVAER
jgi:membrane fusion protein, multidrug efflux system